MRQSTEAQNKAMVLEAFDTLFNKRDYSAAARFWSPNYVRHSAHIEPGRDGLFNLIKVQARARADCGGRRAHVGRESSVARMRAWFNAQ